MVLPVAGLRPLRPARSVNEKASNPTMNIVATRHGFLDNFKQSVQRSCCLRLGGIRVRRNYFNQFCLVRGVALSVD